LYITADARNLLDAKKIREVDPQNLPASPVGNDYMIDSTETDRVGGAYLADTDGNGVEGFVPLNDPCVYEMPRTIRVGVGFEF
jgi:hypothetical protein